jgi:uncharacterized protein YjbI with pentapeptide repeats
MKSRVNQHGVQYTQNKKIETMIKKTMILKAILFTLCSNLQAQDLTRGDVIKLIAIATKPLDLTGTNLGVDLSKLNLKGANLSGANLFNANLSGANLSGANLSGANLSVANFTGADLTLTNFTGANLTGANFTGANLSGANLSGAVTDVNSITGEEYKANFTGAILTGVIGYKKP